MVARWQYGAQIKGADMTDSSFAWNRLRLRFQELREAFYCLDIHSVAYPISSIKPCIAQQSARPRLWNWLGSLYVR
jgi:hypothetical protein